MAKAFLFSILLFVTFQVQAQKGYRPGYILTLQGDTLKGLVHNKGNFKSTLKCDFKGGSTSLIQTFKPGEIKGYGFIKGKIYETKTLSIVTTKLDEKNSYIEEPVPVHGKVNFMQVLVKGKATLYYLKDSGGSDHYYIETDAIPIKELVYVETTKTDPTTKSKYLVKDKLYINALREALKDCPAIDSKIETTQLKPTQLSELLDQYNACTDPGKTITIYRKPRSKFSWGGLVGISYSNLDLDSEGANLFESDPDFTSKPTLTAGLFVDFTAPAISQNLSFNNSFYFTNRKFNSNFTAPTPNHPETEHNFTYNFKYLRMETLLRYTTSLGKKITPFGQFGISNSLALVSEERIQYSFPNNSNPPFEQNNLISPMRNLQFGYVTGVGIKINQFKNKALLFQTNYEFNTGLYRYDLIKAKTHSVVFLLGLEL